MNSLFIEIIAITENWFNVSKSLVKRKDVLSKVNHVFVAFLCRHRIHQLQEPYMLFPNLEV